MLRMPNLDDRFFEEINEDAKKAIRKYLPEWTDEGSHDPGVTFLELFSWLTEMQQYYLNQITEKNELKFLQLLGEYPREAKAAITEVHFDHLEENIYLPEGTKLTGKDLVFETLDPVQLLSAKIEKVIVRTKNGSNDYSPANDRSGVNYFAFGREAEAGNKLFVALDAPVPEKRNVSVTVDLFENYPVRAVRLHEETPFHPSAEVEWTCYGQAEGKEGWFPVEIVQDETYHFTQRGRITFRVPGKMLPFLIQPALDRKRYWLCCELKSGPFETAPKVDQIKLNTTSAGHRHTLSKCFSFDSNGGSGQTVNVHHALAFYGQLFVQVQEGEGWYDWNEVRDLTKSGADDTCYQVRRNDEGKGTTVYFGDGVHGRIPPAGRQSIRIIAMEPDFAAERWLGSTNGIPGQTFVINQSKVAPDSLLIQISRRANGRIVWNDWRRVNQLDRSGQEDRHYILNRATNEIMFGNNENGLLPDFSDSENVRIISCRIGGGSDGNIQQGVINRFYRNTEEWKAIKVSNTDRARGGAEWETLQQVKKRTVQNLGKPSRAVTAEDYERIVRSTPGLRVARVHTIPLYRPGMKAYPVNKAPGEVTVVVVPYSDRMKPVPGGAFLQNVKRHLERYRLLTTEIHVIPPEFIEITVHANVVVEPYFKDESTDLVEGLKAYLKPIDREVGLGGWEFGRPVFKGDIYGVLNDINGVLYVQDLWLEAKGKGCKKLANGDILIPPHALVYSGEHEVELVKQADIPV